MRIAPSSFARRCATVRVGQNGPVSQWAGIESAAPNSSASAPASSTSPSGVPSPSRPAVLIPRLRRTERLVVGSIDGAAHILQRRARDVLVGSALFLVPMVALNLVLAVVAFNRFDSVDGLLGDRGYLGVESGFVLLAVALQSFSAHLIGAYTAAYLVRYQMGGAPRIRDCAIAVLRRLPLLVVTWLLTHWWALLIAWWVIRADAATLAGLVWILPLVASAVSTCVLLVAPVLMTERLGLRSIGRAWRLVRTRYGAAFGFVWACGVLSVLLSLFIAFLPSLAESTGLVTFGSYTWLVQGITSQLALLIVVPFIAIATAQLYLQIRVHAEGLDIAIAADRAFVVQR